MLLDVLLLKDLGGFFVFFFMNSLCSVGIGCVKNINNHLCTYFPLVKTKCFSYFSILQF